MHQVVYVLSGDNMFMNGVNSRLESVKFYLVYEESIYGKLA